MSIRTKIQWCDSTCNPTMGCDGCELWDKSTKKCYAGILHQRFGGASPGYAPSFEEVTLFPGRMEQATKWSDLSNTKRCDKPWLNGMPRLIFVSDMSDALSKAITFDYLQKEVIATVTSDLGRRHQWLWLTKRPARMAKFSQWLAKKGQAWPRNLWAGTSVTSRRMTSRIQPLLDIGDAQTIHFLSVEPQYEEVNLQKWLPKLRWVIQGGESGHGASAFDVLWAKSLIDQCREHGVPYFLKQLGANVVRKTQRLRFDDGHAGDWSEWDTKLQVRQMPAIRSDSASSLPKSSKAIRIDGQAQPKTKAASAKGRAAALKAWETRRARQSTGQKRK